MHDLNDHNLVSNMQNFHAQEIKPIFHDLNLLRVLHALIRTQSITKSGELLGLSQPAASRTVAKLRHALDDPLLVRTRKGYVLTPLAESLLPKVELALKSAESVFAVRSFSPAQSTRSFHICTTDYGALTVVTPFTSILQSVAPGISLVLSPWGDETLTSMEQGDLDLALYADDPIPLDFHYRDLFQENYVVITRKNHPFSQVENVDSESFLIELTRYRQIAARYPQHKNYATDDVLARMGVHQHPIAVATPYFNTAPLMVAESDMFMILPRRAAQRFATLLPIEIIPIPSQQENFKYRIIWHERTHRSPEVKWLRDQIIHMFSNEKAR